MKRLSRHFGWCTLVLAFALVGGSGCLSRQRVYKDIYRNRHRAYAAWKRARAGEKGDRPVLKGDLDTRSAVIIAIGNNKILRDALARKQFATGERTEAYSSALPRFDLTGRYRRLDEANGVNAVTRNSTTLGFALTQPIFTGGAMTAAIRAAQLNELAADENVANRIQQVVRETRRGYLDVLLAGQLVTVSQGELELAKAHLEDVQKKKTAGVVSQFEVLRARVEVSNVEAELIERQNALHIALTTLLKTLGVSQESKVELTEKLEYVEQTPDLEQAVREGYRNRPDLLYAELQVRAQEQRVYGAWGQFFPQLSAGLSQEFARPDPHNFLRDRWGSAWTASLNLDWALFDGLATLGRVQQARAGLRRAAIELADAEEQVLLEIRQAVLSIEDADKFVKSQEENLERAREGVRLAQAGYEAGVNTELEMRDARQALSETQALYYQAVYRHQTARLDLDFAAGRLKDQTYGAKPYDEPPAENR
jgi:outer membrane protein TolC